MFSVTCPDWNAITECIPKFKTKGPHDICVLNQLSFHHGLTEGANVVTEGMQDTEAPIIQGACHEP